ncbi:cactin, partial [Tachysurus ichikawai]
QRKVKTKRKKVEMRGRAKLQSLCREGGGEEETQKRPSELPLDTHVIDAEEDLQHLQLARRHLQLNIFYPDLIDKRSMPQYFLGPSLDNKDISILRFQGGPPYEDIVFKMVSHE